MSTYIKLVSDKDHYYRYLMPMAWGIGFGWIMVGAALVASSLAFLHYQYLALTLVLPVFIFALFLAVNTYDLIRQSNCDYVIEISDHDATLSKTDCWQKKKTCKSILLADIKYAEYYPYLDSASIIFHTSNSDFEMPLWPMGRHARDAVDFLAGTSVKVVDVQSDEVIPD
jgi:hypothetical protein